MQYFCCWPRCLCTKQGRKMNERIILLDNTNFRSKKAHTCGLTVLKKRELLGMEEEKK